MNKTKLLQLALVSLIAISTLAANASAGDMAKAAAKPKGPVCGGIGGLKCPDADQVCKYPAGKCKVADLAGVCVTRPETCTKQHKPVCACDGKTYDNACELLKAGAQMDHKGACVTPK